MAQDAVRVRDWDIVDITGGAAISLGELYQLPDGLAGYALKTYASGAIARFQMSDVVTVPKTTGVVLLPGQRAYWDYSAGSITYKKVGDRDFYAGRVSGVPNSSDGLWASATGFVNVNLNSDPGYDLWMCGPGKGSGSAAWKTAITGTQAVDTMGLYPRGGLKVIHSATSEAQKIDALGLDTFSRDANAIIEFVFRVPSDGAGTVVDINVGVASDTHATDADSIAIHLFMHLDANNVNINFQSKDGTTTVASTDSTIDYTEDTGFLLANRVFVQMDIRDPSDIQIYVNGALVLPATVFRLDNAASEVRLLLHAEKTSSTDTYEFALDEFRGYFAKQ